jgi:hypothetical protein
VKSVRRGFSVPLQYEHYVSGSLAAPDTYVIDIVGPHGDYAVHDDGAEGVTMNDVSMEKVSTGVYCYNYKPKTTATIGIYSAEPKFTTGTFVAGLPDGPEPFEVKKEVG